MIWAMGQKSVTLHSLAVPLICIYIYYRARQLCGLTIRTTCICTAISKRCNTNKSYQTTNLTSVYVTHLKPNTKNVELEPSKSTRNITEEYEKKGSAKKYHLVNILQNHELWIGEQEAGLFSYSITEQGWPDTDMRLSAIELTPAMHSSCYYFLFRNSILAFLSICLFTISNFKSFGPNY